MASPLGLLRFHAATFLAPSSPTARLPTRRPSLLPLFSTVSSLPLTLMSHSEPAFVPYGPSLRKGLPRLPPPPSGGDDEGGSDLAVDRERFSRVFDLAALRVPAERCAGLEGHLRGHLLNWPRVRNVARVPGDEVDPEVAELLREDGGGGFGERLEPALRRARGEDDGEEAGEGALSPVLYREKLVKEFNYRGFVRFRNLAKMSRPKKKKKKKKGRGKEEEEGEGAQVKCGRGKGDFSLIEIVRVCREEGGLEDKDEGLSRLLGDDLPRGRWPGSTRLLLLDERYASKGVEELPEAVKVA